MLLIGNREAQIEVITDLLIDKEGSRDLALLHVVRDMYTEAKVSDT